MACGVCGCAQRRIDRAQKDAQAIATTLANTRKVKATYCPSAELLRAYGDLPGDVSTKDPWGVPFIVTCRGDIVTVTSPGPDRTMGTTDDVHATAVTIRAPTSTGFSPYSTSPPSPAPTSKSLPELAAAGGPACVQCEQTRVACLLDVQRGALVPGAEAFADPVEASRQGCALDAMACFTEANCPRK